ncbi:unnamed protein product [Lymnaea stagnalis]|uniref:Uncharacterized protein n=1 Tax=Lymnaea stagnalis TaxID=6523 RepID=A0AAV2IN88_LYMST
MLDWSSQAARKKIKVSSKSSNSNGHKSSNRIWHTTWTSKDGVRYKNKNWQLLEYIINLQLTSTTLQKMFWHRLYQGGLTQSKQAVLLAWFHSGAMRRRKL